MKRPSPFLIAVCAASSCALWFCAARPASAAPQVAGQTRPGAAASPSANAPDSADADRFDCYAAAPRSHWYASGDYLRALEEIQPLASDGCAPAQHLLAVMYGKGQGVREDPVRAYAWLLVAFAMGATPFGGGANAARLGDDPKEFEIVQFGARLTDEQLAQAEALAARLVSPRAIAANGAVGPTGIADAIKELRPRRAGWRLNGKLAVLSSANAQSSLLAKASPGGAGGAYAQWVTEANGGAIPHQLAFVEAELKDVALGVAGGRQDLARELDLAASQGERFERLALGGEVRIARFGVNAGFASQVELVAAPGPDSAGRRYWVDNCFLKMKDPRDAALLRAARGDACDKPR